MTPADFKEQVEKQFNIILSDEQMNQFERYFELLVEWNQKMNLTAITARDEVYEKHFYDSLTLLQAVDLTTIETLCDVGSGAGFPSMPLKIVFPHLNVSIIDSLNKRITFLNHLADELNLSNCHFIHARAEEAGQNKAYRNQFDLVTARAVAQLNVLAELCLPLVKKNGQFLAMKGAKGLEEVEQAKRAIALLGGKVEQTSDISLPEEDSQRYLIQISKPKDTPKKYPRQPGKPNKQPLK
ncbi:16S rRNA (guanine(527)-N(7))-methyltransferase RsmG [Atopobacter phocae]|uniref:16S rRNA (guanine(527)-N(7))-methyltransferase RsmG n=1 Tax=Atopobacter phocae TaxID=136492 RepID=UPI000472EF89|nr:16S rRNA (guanine(527)-N(7))-methyltransferase RsmG [Atopobacter phocae]